MKILIIEDNLLVLNSLKFKLSKDGYEVSIAQDGKAGIQQLETSTFDVVLTDLMLPFITGMEILVHVRKNYPSTKVIVISNAEQESNILNAFELGADDFITKPFSPGELSLRIKRLVNIAR